MSTEIVQKSNIIERLKEVMDDNNLKRGKFADIIGFSRGLVSDVLNGNLPITDKFINAVCLKFELSESWIKTGEGEKNRKGRKTIEVSLESNTQDDFITIPLFSDSISAGHGLMPSNEIGIRFSFRRDWIEKKGDPGQMSLIRVTGDSMEPTLFSGDLVLVNHGKNYLDPQGGIYAIAIDGLIMIKRLQFVYPQGTAKVISDNNKYDSVEISHEQVKINGRVIWFSREI